MSILFEKRYEWGEVRVDKISHPESYYIERIDFSDEDTKELECITHPQARMQWLASRSLLKELSRESRQLEMKKKDSGKPHFLNHEAHFSISHSDDKVAVIYSRSREVSVDIEAYDSKIIRIKRKFIHPYDFEQDDNLENLTLIWSAKESIYKYFENPSLAYFKDNIAVTKKNKNTLDFELNNIDSKHLTLEYETFETFVLTYVF